jgi:MFS family permease
MFAALRLRDFRLLWLGRLVSSMGTWLLTIAVPAYALHLTGSLMATGLTLAAEYLPLLLLGPIAGVFTDRWDRRRVMLAADLFRAVAVSLMLFARGPDTVWILYVALAAESVGSILFRPAAQAHIPAVVGKGPMLSSANSLSAFTDGIVRLVGAPLGAALMVVVGFHFLIWVDVASYLVSAVAILLTARRAAAPRSSRTTVRQIGLDLREGFAALSRQPMARGLLLVSTVFLVANASLSALLVPLGVTRLGGVEQAGIVVSALGVGFLLGAPLIRVLVDRLQARTLLTAALLCTAAGFYALFTSTSLVTAVPAAVGIGVFGSMALIVPQTTLQRVLPDGVLGRVSAVFFTGEALATLIGAVAGPALAEGAGMPAVVRAACGLTALTALSCLLLLPRLAVLVPPATEADEPTPAAERPPADHRSVEVGAER